MKIGKPTHQWRLLFEGDWPTSVAFVSDNHLAAGNRQGDLFAWDLSEPPTEEGEDGDPPNRPPTTRLAGHTNGITHLRAARDGKTLISASLDHTVRVWNIQDPSSGKSEVVLDSKSRESRARNKRGDDKAKILEAPGVTVDDVAETYSLTGHAGWINALDISADGRRLISGDDQCLSIVWDLKTRDEVSRWEGYDRVWVRSAALSPDGATAFTCEYAGRRSNFDAPAAQARLWNVEDGSQRLDLLKVWTPDVKDKDRQDTYGYWRTWSKLMKRGLVAAAFSPDGSILAVAQGGETDTGKIHLVDSKSGEILRTVSGHRYGACDVKFSADGQYVLSTGRDTTLRICQTADGKEVAALGKSRGGQFKDWLYGVAVSPDQTRVAAADIAGFVHVWTLDG